MENNKISLNREGYYNDPPRKHDESTGEWIYNQSISDHPVESWKIPRKKKPKKVSNKKQLDIKEEELKDTEAEQQKIDWNQNAGILSDIK